MNRKDGKGRNADKFWYEFKAQTNERYKNRMDDHSAYEIRTLNSNDQNGARSDFGVYWGPKLGEYIFVQGANVSETNKAEIEAAIRSVSEAKGTRLRRDPTDNCQQKFLNNWIPVTNKPVKNRADYDDLKTASNGFKDNNRHLLGDSGNAATDRSAKRGILKRN
uniref:Uncharacterized protein n=1 Tax=Strigamia maritima TaxID=126957 RepID=T1J9W9_STRMM